MLKESQKNEYINNLNEIIDFFKLEKENTLSHIIMGKEDSKFNNTFFISISVVLIAITNTLMYTEIFPENSILFIIIFILFILCMTIIGESISSKRRTDRYIRQSARFNVILNFLQSLKILKYEVKLLPLINIVKKRYHISTWFIELNKEKYFSDIWFEEIIDCLNIINREINERENDFIDKDEIK